MHLTASPLPPPSPPPPRGVTCFSALRLYFLPARCCLGPGRHHGSSSVRVHFTLKHTHTLSHTLPLSHNCMIPPDDVGVLPRSLMHSRTVGNVNDWKYSLNSGCATTCVSFDTDFKQCLTVNNSRYHSVVIKYSSEVLYLSISISFYCLLDLDLDSY